MRSAALLAITGLLVLACLAACGSDDDSTPSPTQAAADVNTGPPPGPREQPAPAQPLTGSPVEPKDGVIEVSILDALFQQNYLHVPLGESVTIRVTNKDQIQHSLRLAGLDGQFGTEDDAVANPPQIDGGGVAELTFAPLAAGAYTFRCDFHPGTMGGQIVVGDATPGSAPTDTPAATDTETPAPQGRDVALAPS